MFVNQDGPCVLGCQMMAVVAVMADTTTFLFFVMGVVVGTRLAATSH